MREQPVTHEELHAYVDGLLPAERRSTVESHLADNPRDAEWVAVYRRQNELLRAGFAVNEREPIPERLKTKLRGSERWRGYRVLSRIAAAVLLVVAGGFGGWFLRGTTVGTPPAESFVREAATAHRVYVVEQRHPVEVAAADKAHLVGWLSNRLGVPIWVPDLSDFGFRFVGGRLLPGDGGPAAQLMYEDAGGQRLTCYITPDKLVLGGGARYVEDADIALFAWPVGQAAYAVIGDEKGDSLQDIAKAINRQFSSAGNG